MKEHRMYLARFHVGGNRFLFGQVWGLSFMDARGRQFALSSEGDDRVAAR